MRILSLLLISFCSYAQVGHFIQDNRVVNVKVVSGFTDTDRYYTPDGTGPSLNLTGFSWWIVEIPARNQTTTNIQFAFGKSLFANNRDWGSRTFQGNIRPLIDGDTGPATTDQKNAQATNCTWAELNKIRVLHFVISNNVVYMYRNGCLLGYGGSTAPGLSKPSITQPLSTSGIGIGGYPGASGTVKPYEGGIIAAGIASSTGLTAAQVKAHYNALLTNVYATPTGATNLWRSVDAGATWTDNIGGLVATRFGSPTVTDRTVPFYPYYDVHESFGDTAPILPQLPNTVGSLDVMTLGDSRTAAEGSYRLYFENNRVASGMTNLRWVGRYPNSSDPDYINNYGWKEKSNGMPGQSAQACLDGSGGFPPIASELVTFNPDIIVMWWGQNAGDLITEPERAPIESIIRTAYAYNPNIRFVLCSEITGWRQSAVAGGGIQAKFDALDQWKQRLVSKLKNEGFKIIYCRITETINWEDSNDWPSGAINSIGSITGGSGYTNGSYSSTVFTGGSPYRQATGTVTVSGGIVTGVTVTSLGIGYAPGDVLSASIPGGSGFSFPVNAVVVDNIHPLPAPYGNPSANVGYNKIGAEVFKAIKIIAGY